MELDNLIGLTIKNISLLCWKESSSKVEFIEKIAFTFEDNQFLLVKVKEDTDEINLEINETLELFATEKEHYILSVGEANKYKELKSIVNSKIEWIWTLTNNKNYQDGLEIEFYHRETEKITFRFLVIASNIKISILNPIHSK